MILPSLLRRSSVRVESPSPTYLASQSGLLQRLMRDRSKAQCDALQETVEAAGELCESDCAGITRLERLPEGYEAMRWVAATGPLRPSIGQPIYLDRNLKSVLKGNRPRLICRPHRLFSQIAHGWQVTEALLVPWAGDCNSGILWIIQRGGSKRLNTDDIRMLTHLAAFASFTLEQQEMDAFRRDAALSATSTLRGPELAQTRQSNAR
jgi:hypothetical protein